MCLADHFLQPASLGIFKFYVHTTSGALGGDFALNPSRATHKLNHKRTILQGTVKLCKIKLTNPGYMDWLMKSESCRTSVRI